MKTLWQVDNHFWGGFLDSIPGKLSSEELMLLNYGVGKGSRESLGQQGVKPINPKGNR